MKEITMEELFKMFDPSVHSAINEAIKRNDAWWVVVYENQQMDGSQYGSRSALTVGGASSCRKLEDLGSMYPRLGDVPSRFKYPVAYAKVV